MQANASVGKNTTMKIFFMPFCAYSVSLDDLVGVLDRRLPAVPSSLMLALMNSTAR
jgi:hypothetical protein